MLEQNVNLTEDKEVLVQGDATEVKGVTEEQHEDTNNTSKKLVPQLRRKAQDKNRELEYIKPTSIIMKEIRMKFNLSQLDIATKTGIVQQMISKIDTNVTNPRLSSVKKYLEACGIDLDELLMEAYNKMEDKR